MWPASEGPGCISVLDKSLCGYMLMFSVYLVLSCEVQPKSVITGIQPLHFLVAKRPAIPSKSDLYPISEHVLIGAEKW